MAAFCTREMPQLIDMLKDLARITITVQVQFSVLFVILSLGPVEKVLYTGCLLS